MHAETHQPLNKRTYRGVYVDPRLHWEALPEGAIFPPSYGNAPPRISLQHLLRRIWVAPKNSGFVAWFMESMESGEQFPGTLVRQWFIYSTWAHVFCGGLCSLDNLLCVWELR
jgi:hypothetical protein